MAGLAATAASIGLALSTTAQVKATGTSLRFNDLRYEIQSVTQSSGLGSALGECAGPQESYVMVVFRVTNNGDHDRSAQAIPHVTLVDPFGQPYSRDARLSRLIETSASPLLSFRQGQLRMGQAAVIADLFITPRNAIGVGAWMLRPSAIGGQTARLPGADVVADADCQGSSRPREPGPVSQN